MKLSLAWRRLPAHPSRPAGAGRRLVRPGGRGGISYSVTEITEITPKLLRPDGTQVTHGMVIYDMARDDRIQRIVGFFGDPPAVTP
jgi:hypothetical protein